ncbi:hypothetical protein KC361_g31 [Hortaea werneckii]|nr:hypothetical protein KC361_g31 [Hortaea werneckii]
MAGQSRGEIFRSWRHAGFTRVSSPAGLRTVHMKHTSRSEGLECDESQLNIWMCLEGTGKNGWDVPRLLALRIRIIMRDKHSYYVAANLLHVHVNPISVLKVELLRVSTRRISTLSVKPTYIRWSLLSHRLAQLGDWLELEIDREPIHVSKLESELLWLGGSSGSSGLLRWRRRRVGHILDWFGDHVCFLDTFGGWLEVCFDVRAMLRMRILHKSRMSCRCFGFSADVDFVCLCQTEALN